MLKAFRYFGLCLLAGADAQLVLGELQTLTHRAFDPAENEGSLANVNLGLGTDINDLLRPGEALLMDRFAMDVTAASGNDALYTEFQRLTRAFVGKLLEARRGSD